MYISQTITNMKIQNLLFLFLALQFLASCGKTESETVLEPGEITAEDEVELIETSQLNLANTEYLGTFSGKVGNREVAITFLEDYEFEMTDNGKEASGTYERLEDGTRIELFPSKGSVRIKFLALSDSDYWIVLDNEGEYPDKEEFLKKSK